jgi:hypothetical protein
VKRCWQEFLEHVPHEGCAPHAAAHAHAEPDVAGRVAQRLQPDVVEEDGGAIRRRAAHRDLELARQVREFGVEGRPLAQQLAPDEGIHDLVGGDPGEMVGRDVAEGIAAGLNGVHLHRGELGQDVGHFLQARPVELDVLPRAEMAIAAVPGAGDMRQRTQLARRQLPVGNRHPQHRCVALDVEAVAQPQRAEIVFRQLAGKETLGLFPELGHPLIHQLLVYFVVLIHRGCPVTTA